MTRRVHSLQTVAKGWHRPQHLSKTPIKFHTAPCGQGKAANTAETDPNHTATNTVHHKQAELHANN